MNLDLSQADDKDVQYALALAGVVDAPVEAAALARLGFQAAMTGQAEAALYPLIAAVNAAPKEPSYRAALGVAYARCNRIEEALRELRQCLALRPNDLEVSCIVAELLLDKLDYNGAAVLLRKCLTLDPKAEHPAGIRARALIKKGEKLLKQAVG